MTAQTADHLKTITFKDGGGKDYVNPGSLREFVDSVPIWLDLNWANVKSQFQAAGDGLTDDILAFNGAIASGASTVFVPDGTYIVSASVTMNVANQRLLLSSGATIKAQAGTNIRVVRLAAAGTVITGGTIDGNRANVTDTDGIEIQQVDDAVIDDVTVKACHSWGIHGIDCSRATIKNNHVSDTGNIAIEVETTLTSMTLTDTYIGFNTIDRTAEGTGILFGAIHVHANTTGSSLRRTRIIGNTTSLPVSPTGGGVIGVETQGPNYGTIVQGNTHNSGETGISINNAILASVTGNTTYNSSSYGIEVAGGDHCTVTGNTVEGNGRTQFGIECNLDTVNIGNTVTGCTVKDCTNVGIRMYQATGGTVSANDVLISAATQEAITVYASTGIQISGGDLNGASTGGSGIVLSDSSNITITGVGFRNWTTSAVTLFVDTAGTYDNIIIDGCTLVSSGPVISTNVTTGTLGNNIAAMNCTGVVGASTTNGNARRGSCLDWVNQVWDFIGSGSPASSVTAGPGSVYRNQAGGTSTTFYVKETGTGNTGWVAK